MSLAVCTVSDVSHGGRKPVEVRWNKVKRICSQIEEETYPLKEGLEWVVEDESIHTTWARDSIYRRCDLELSRPLAPNKGYRQIQTEEET